MSVQARFFVSETARMAAFSGAPAAPKPSGGGRVVLVPVTRGDANREWASATPSGRIEMTVSTAAFGWFEDRVGREVAVTFEDRPAGG